MPVTATPISAQKSGIGPHPLDTLVSMVDVALGYRIPAGIYQFSFGRAYPRPDSIIYRLPSLDGGLAVERTAAAASTLVRS